MTLRRMPIQLSPESRRRLARGERIVRVTELPGPMFGEPEERRSREWHDQSLQTIADRSGFDGVEAACVFTGVHFNDAKWDEPAAHRILAALRTAFQRGRAVMRLSVERVEGLSLTPQVLAYARASFRSDVAALLDDPSDLLHPHREREPAEELADRRLLAGQLGLDFDARVAEAGTPFERQRLADIESGALPPAPAAAP